MSFEIFVASRFLWTKRKGLFAFITTLIGVAGVAIGVAALITTLSVMNGFQADIQKKIIGAQAHLIVFGEFDKAGLGRLQAYLNRQPETAATAPFALGQAIITYRERSVGVVLRGLDPKQEFQVNDLAKTLQEGSWEPLTPTLSPKGRGAKINSTAPPSGRMKTANEPLAPEGERAGVRDETMDFCVLGSELARILGVWIGEEVILISPQGAATPLGLIPKMHKFKVAGLIKTGYYEYDSSTAYVELRAAAAFLGLPAGASGVEVRLRNLDQADAVARRFQKELGFAHTVRSFKQMNQTLFAALKLEKYMMFLILTLIILVATFNIASNLILLGTEKLRDIGLLKAMGATPRQIYRIFFYEGLLIGGVGVGLGTALGIALSLFIKHYPLIQLPADIYYLSQVPVHIDPKDLATTVLCGFLLTVLATLYPAARAAKVHPVEAIHYYG